VRILGRSGNCWSNSHYVLTQTLANEHQSYPEYTAEAVYYILQEESHAVRGGNREKYQNLLKAIREVFPNITMYLLPNSDNEIVVGKASLTPAAVEVVLDYLEQQGLLNGVTFYVCDEPKYDNLEQGSLRCKMEEILKVMDQPNGPTRAAFLIKGSNIRHFTPIFLTKNLENKFEILLSDSVCNFNFYGESLNTAKQVMESNKRHFQLYVHAGCARQYDDTNCAVFCIQDVINMCHASSEIFSWIKANGSNAESPATSSLLDKQNAEYLENNTHYFENLPPLMVKLVQRREELKKYQEAILKLINGEKLLQTPIPSNQSGDETLDEFIERHQVKMGESIINYKASELFMQYERYIIAAEMRVYSEFLISN